MHGRPGPARSAGLGTLATVDDGSQAAQPAAGHPELAEVRARISQGGAARYHEQAAAQGKMFARDRIALLVDDGSFTEDGAFANVLADGLPADGVITGTATIGGRPVALMANDSTVKAGSWGARTVEKIIRIIEQAYATGVPMIYLVDSAGRADHRPGADVPRPPRRGQDLPHPGPGVRVDPAGVRAVRAVGRGRRLHPGVLRLRRHGRRQRVDVPGQPADGRDGGQRADHAGGDGRRADALLGLRLRALPGAAEADAIAAVRDYLSYLPGNWQQPPPPRPARPPKPTDLRAMVPVSERQAFDMRRYVRGIVDEDSFFEIHALWARELVIGFAALDGQPVGVVANNPMFKGGVLFVDSADKATRFIQLCDAFSLPLLFLADVPGFMVGTAVERQGIIRHGAKMISAGVRGHRARRSA